MPKNKITIGVDEKNKIDKTNQLSNKELYTPPSSVIKHDSKSKQLYLDDTVWGNDFKLDKKLDEEYLFEKRRYVRVRYIQRIECRMVSNSPNDAFITLNRPIILTMSDISMAGIGVVCSDEMNIGFVLEFDIVLDHLKYNIRCEVVYCVRMEDEENYRIGLKVIKKEKEFVKHLKILVARLSLQLHYGSCTSLNEESQ